MRPVARMCYLIAIATSVIGAGFLGLYFIIPFTPQQEAVFIFGAIVMGLAVGTLFIAKLYATWLLEKHDEISRTELIKISREKRPQLMSRTFLYFMLLLSSGTLTYVLYLGGVNLLFVLLFLMISLIAMVFLFKKAVELEPALPGPGRD